MSETTFTHKDLARMLGVSETTVKSYRRKFPGCIPVANQGKPIRFTQEGATVAARIRALFDTGMSVEEVRRRLADEFSFISPDARPPQSVRQEPARAGEQGPGPELTIGVSNMAKGMVALTQQQKAILSRVQSLESMLEELGLGQTRENLTRIGEERRKETRQREALLEDRLDRLDESTKELSRTVHTLADQLGRLMEKRARAEEERRARDAQTLSTADAGAGPGETGGGPLAAPASASVPSASATGAPLPPPYAPQGAWTAQPACAPDGQDAGTAPAAYAPAASGLNTPGPAAPDPYSPASAGGQAAGVMAQAEAAPEPTSARIIPLRPENGDKALLRGTQRPGFSSPRPDARVVEAPSEPPRLFFSLPLVVRTEEGRYISAGGRSRGRFSLNDLKAMLIYGYTPPDHFSLRWEQQGTDWWLFLERETNDKALHLLLTELTAQRGGNAAEILQIRRSGETCYPVEICAIIDALAAREF